MPVRDDNGNTIQMGDLLAWEYYYEAGPTIAVVMDVTENEIYVHNHVGSWWLSESPDLHTLEVISANAEM